MNIVYGFGGMRSDGEVLVFNPSMPEQWKGFGFKLVYHGSVLKITINNEYADFRILKGSGLTIRVYGKEYSIDEKGITVKITGH